MKGELIWFQSSDLGEASLRIMLDKLGSSSMMKRHSRTGRFLGLSARTGHQGEQADVNESALIEELRETGQVTFKYWLRGKADSDVVISIDHKEGGYAINASFDGMSVDDAVLVTSDFFQLSLSSYFASSSLGLVVDDALPDSWEDWWVFFLEGGPYPGHAPQLMWHRRDAHHGITLRLRNNSWLALNTVAASTFMLGHG